MITHRSVLRFSSQSGLFDRAIRVFGPRSEPSVSSNQPLKSLFQIQPVHSVRGLEGLQGSTYLHSNSQAVANLNVVPQLLGNLYMKVNSSVCPPFAVSLRRSIHSSSQKVFETTERNTRSMNILRGIIEGDRRNIQFRQYSVRRSIWKGSFLDAFLLRMKKKRDLLLNRKIWSRRSSILPEFVDCPVRIYNGKTFVRCKITEGKVGHKFGEFALTRKRRPSRTNIGLVKKKGKK